MSEYGSPSSDLMDADTGEYIGRATIAQVEASDRAAESDGGCGIILIDGDGDVVSQAEAGRFPNMLTRRVYTATSADLLFGFSTKGPK